MLQRTQMYTSTYIFIEIDKFMEYWDLGCSHLDYTIK